MSARRQLAALLFADIVGFTRMSSQDEARSVRLVEHFEAAVRGAAAAHDGTIVKFMGDGALAHFSSTEAAIKAALALRDDFAQRTLDDGFVDANLRAGVHVGDILIRDDADVLGDGVNVASRIQSVARPGEIVVSDEVWRQARHLGAFRFQALGAQRLKGLPERRSVWVVEAAGGDAGSQARQRRRTGRAFGTGAAAVAALLVAGVAAWLVVFQQDGAPTHVPATPITSLVVLPFDNLSGNPDEEYLVAGMHDALIGELTEISSLRVISRTSAIRYRDSQLPLREIARELNVEAVVAASVLRSGDNLRIRSELVQVFPHERSLWTGSFDREVRDVLALYGDIAQALAEAIRLRLTPGEAKRLEQSAQVNPDAYMAYLRGRFHWNLHTATDLDQALRHFQAALEHDPDYAPAYAGIASVWYGRRQLGVTPPAEASRELMAAVERALALDPDLARAHHALAVELAWGDWDWAGAERHFVRALELNPGDALTRSFHSLVLRIMQRFDESLVEARRAVELDPFNPVVRGILAGALWHLGRADEALEVFDLALADSPGHPILMRDHPSLLHMAGRYPEALAATRALYEVAGDREMVAALDSADSNGGYVAAMLRAAELSAARVTQGHAPNSRVAHYYVRAGRNDEALVWLERTVAERESGATFLRSKFYDALRGNPRFEALLRAVNI